MGDPDTAATGAVLRPATLRRYALEAGFSDLEVLPVEAGMLRFYRLDRELWRQPRAHCVLCVSWPSVIVRTCAANIGR